MVTIMMMTIMTIILITMILLTIIMINIIMIMIMIINYTAAVALPTHRLPGTHPWARRSLRGCSFASLASPLLQRKLVSLQPGRFTTRFGCLVRRGSSKQISFVSIIAGSKLGAFAEQSMKPLVIVLPFREPRNHFPQLKQYVSF